MLRTTITRLAAVLLALALLGLPAAATAEPAITLSPTSGPPGTVVNYTVTGLDPSSGYLIQLVAGAGNVNTTRLAEETATSDASGQISGRLTVRQQPGTYSIRVVSRGGTVLASAELTIADGAAATSTPTAAATPTTTTPPPTLPRLGAGGMAPVAGPPWLLLAGGLALAALAWRRRRS